MEVGYTSYREYFPSLKKKYLWKSVYSGKLNLRNLMSCNPNQERQLHPQAEQPN